MMKKTQKLWFPPLLSYQTYIETLKELNSDEVFEGLLGYGLFAEVLPPIFTSELFLDFCLMNKPIFTQEKADYIKYESIRNNNSVRLFGIPTPFTYYNLCTKIRDKWTDILKHFEKMTVGQKHKISRLHVRKLYQSKSLFQMNYQNWWKDETPSTDLSIGARFLVRADISTCFPSIYTHAIAWALMTKQTAKQTMKVKATRHWEHHLDKLVRSTTNLQTQGILIGPHASNIISEIILTAVDKELYKRGFSYIRFIDDYECYVSSYEEAEEFLRALRGELREYELLINDKKTKIIPLPISKEYHWTNRLNQEEPIPINGVINYKQIKRFLDLAISLVESNDDDLSILKYALKMVSEFKLSHNARVLAQKHYLHLAIIYPYLVRELEKYVFESLKTDPNVISDWSNEFFPIFLKQGNYEAAAYLIYFAIKYNFEIKDLSEENIIDTTDCIVKALGSIYFLNRGSKKYIDIYNDALRLSQDTIQSEQQWLYWYTTLEEKDLTGDWKDIKRAGISFVN